MNRSKHQPVWIDVRTPSEYERAHVVGAHNLPLFTDEERAIVGTTYVHKSREAAIEQGLSLIGPRLHLLIREIRCIVGEPTAAPPLMLYCARGGMRSHSVAWLLRLYGYDVSTYEGGFRAYKRKLLTLSMQIQRLIVIEGPTGSGKTELLYHLSDLGAQTIDLEGLCCHRGSAFGQLPNSTQPTSEMLACLLIHKLSGMNLSAPIYIESESQRIGHVQIPDVFFDVVRSAEVVTIHQPLEERARRIYDEYATLSVDFLIEAFRKITKRLGAEQTTQAIGLIRQGDLHTPIMIALRYYDSAYAKSGHTLFSGKRKNIEVKQGDLRRTAVEILNRQDKEDTIL